MKFLFYSNPILHIEVPQQTSPPTKIEKHKGMHDFDFKTKTQTRRGLNVDYKKTQQDKVEKQR